MNALADGWYRISRQMISIHLQPTIAQLGPFALTWHGLYSVVGIFAGVWLAARMIWPRDLETVVYELAPWTILGGFAGARLLHVIDNWEYYAERPASILAITEGGIAVFGSILGGTLAGWLYVRWQGWPPGPLADAAAFGLVLGQAIGRIGDIINGEHHGTHAPGLPWAFVYTHPDTLGEPHVPAHPAVAYEMLWNLAGLGVLWWVHGRRPRPGVVFWAYLVLYALGRLWTGFLRQDRHWLAGLSQAQLVALGTIAIAAPALIWLVRSQPQPAQRRG